MWVAHLLTLTRVPLAALFWLAAPRPTVALVVLAVAATTDLVDGRVARAARRRGATGRFADAGAWLDPLCDKLFAVTVLAALAIRTGAPLGLLVLIGARELIVGPLAILYRVTPLRRRYHQDFHASRAGKLATAGQFVAIAAIVLALPGTLPLAVAAAALGLVATAGYLRGAATAATGTAGGAGRVSGEAGPASRGG